MGLEQALLLERAMHRAIQHRFWLAVLVFNTALAAACGGDPAPGKPQVDAAPPQSDSALPDRAVDAASGEDRAPSPDAGQRGSGGAGGSGGGGGAGGPDAAGEDANGGNGGADGGAGSGGTGDAGLEAAGGGMDGGGMPPPDGGSVSTKRPPPGTKSPGCGMPAGLTDGVKTVQAGGQQVRYYLNLPANYQPNTAYPVVFGFHGGHGDANTTPNTPGFRAAFADRAILAFPEVPNGGVWIADPAAGLTYFDAVLDQISAKLCVDRGRVMATGYSAGGFFAGWLSCKRSDVVRAVAPVTSRMPLRGKSDFVMSSYQGCGGPVAGMVIHPSNDSTHPGETGIEQGRGLRDFLLRTNGCQAASIATDPSPCVAHSGCKAGHPVHWCQFTGGHEWPAFANQGILNFFAQF